MKKRDIGAEVLQGINEIKGWKKGELKLRIAKVKMPTASNVATIRNQLGLSQADFATFMGVSVATLRNWEQGRREPHGSAKSLLLIADKSPDAFLKAFNLRIDRNKAA
jgi:putative transcriptional regulator